MGCRFLFSCTLAPPSVIPCPYCYVPGTYVAFAGGCLRKEPCYENVLQRYRTKHIKITRLHYSRLRLKLYVPRPLRPLLSKSVFVLRKFPSFFFLLLFLCLKECIFLVSWFVFPLKEECYVIVPSSFFALCKISWLRKYFPISFLLIFLPSVNFPDERSIFLFFLFFADFVLSRKIREGNRSTITALRLRWCMRYTQARWLGFLTNMFCKVRIGCKGVMAA